MSKPLKFKKLLAPVRQALERLPEHRRGKNTRYSLAEAGLSGYRVTVSCGICSIRWIRQGSKRHSGRSMRSWKLRGTWPPTPVWGAPA